MDNENIKFFNQLWEQLSNQGDDSDKNLVKNDITGIVSAVWTNNRSDNKLTIVIYVSEKEELWLIFPTLISIPFLGKNIKVCDIDIKEDWVKKSNNETDAEIDNNKRRIYVNNAKYEKLQINGYLFNKEFKSFVSTNVIKKFKISGKKPTFIKGTAKILLIVPENTRSQGEADFLLILHPHAWKSITKERINTRSPEKIAEGFKDIADNIKKKKYGDINCLCVISGGGPNAHNFSSSIVHKAAKKLQTACSDKIYMISGVGHATDGVSCSVYFDYVAVTPTDAAYFLNTLLGF